jgi:spore photoproduct lyase
MYRLIADELARFVSSRTCVYFCMENDPIWREVFGFCPGDKGGLGRMLDRTVTL